MRTSPKLALALLAALVLLLAVMLVRTARFGTAQGEAPAEAAYTAPAGAAERLAEAIRIPTLSNQDSARFDTAAFGAFHALLRQRFPRVHARLRREAVGGYSLLYTWPGTDPSLPPVLLMGHMDMVPVEPGTEARWTWPPFSGALADGFVWGRGALDDQVSVMGTLEAVEMLLTQGFAPRRTVMLAYGHDEETGGRGARQVAAIHSPANEFAAMNPRCRPSPTGPARAGAVGYASIRRAVFEGRHVHRGGQHLAMAAVESAQADFVSS